MAKIRNFDSFGGCIPTFLPMRGEKPIFGPLSENNTGMAALRAGLPVTTYNGKSYNRMVPFSLTLNDA